MRKTRKRTGVSLVAAIALSLAAAPAIHAAAGDKRKKAPPSYAVIAGTVFRDSGFTLRGAEVTLEPVPDPKSRKKPKKMTALSDTRGEFAFRLPAEPLRYTVTVRAEGFKAQQKGVSIQGEERVDVFFQLDSEPK